MEMKCADEKERIRVYVESLFSCLIFFYAFADNVMRS